MKEQTLGKEIQKRLGELERLRQPWEGLWTDIATYIIPRRWDIQNRGAKGQKTGTSIYDGTALGALNLLADGLHGYLVSPSMQWFRLVISNEGLNDLVEVQAWLQTVAREMYSEFAQSNFYEAMSEVFLDGGSIGTATLYLEEDIGARKLNFSCRHPGEIFIAEDHMGKVDTVFRKFKLSARQAAQKFGFEKLPDRLQLSVEKSPDQEYEFCHAVFPREDRNVTKLDSKNMPYASVYTELGQNEVVSEGGYKSVPYCVWRWRKNSNEIYGRGPGSDALVDVLKANQMSKDLLKVSHMAADPPYNVPMEMKGRVRIEPHGFNYYDRDNRVITPVQTMSNFPIGIDREERTQRIIEDHFKVEFFLMLARAEREMTATEVLEKQGEKAAVLGTTIGRLNTECLNMVIDRVFDLMWDAGKLPDPPEQLIDSGVERLEVDYLGPLAQAQRKLFRTQGIVSAIERAAPLIQLNPEAADIINTDEAMRYILDATGAPVKAIRSREEVQQIREQRQQAMAQEQQMIATERTAGVTKQLAQADKLTEGAIGEELEAQMGQ